MLSSLAYTKDKRQTSGFVLENSAEYAEYVLKEGCRLLQSFQAPSTNFPRQRLPESPRTLPHDHTTSPAPPPTEQPSNGKISIPEIPDHVKKSAGALELPNGAASLDTSHGAEEQSANAHVLEYSLMNRPSPTPSQSTHQAEVHLPSTDCRLSSSPPFSPPQASGSAGARRRSGRAKNKPSTYNLRVLSGLDRFEEDDDEGEEKEEVAETAPSSTPERGISHVQSLPSLPTATGQSSQSVPKKEPRRTQNLSRNLWDRELHGHGSRNAFYAAATSDLRIWKSWKGASNDVVALAWSPDATRFAAGATAQSDEYNRKNNLIYGDLVQGHLHELPDHFTRHSSPQSVTDERMYTSVTDMQWVGDKLYTASYDNTVKIWNVAPYRHPSCLQTLRHQSKVVLMDVSKRMPNFIATGTDSFHLWKLQQDQDAVRSDLEITRDIRQKAVGLVPTALAWGHTNATSNFLVGGMAEGIQDEYKVPLLGHMGLWAIGESSITSLKVSPHSQNVFDIKWHPSEPRYAAATTYSQAMQLPLKTRTVVQVYDYSDGTFMVHRSNRFPCPAADINATGFCPMNSFYITASCTDGRTYVWDVRNNEKTVHRLEHDLPLQPLYDNYPREYTDYGVSAALWGATVDQFYTGGSDGFLKQWDIRRSPEDVMVANTANFQEGITSAAFSEDKTQLLTGLHCGGIRVLSVAPCSSPENTGFTFHSALDPPSQECSGQEASRVLLSSGEIERHPIYGPGQGPNYKGPYARWARGLDQDTPLEQTRHIPLKEEYRIRQLCDSKGTNRPQLDPHGMQEIQMQRRIAQARNSQLTRTNHPKAPQVDHQSASTGRNHAIDYSVNTSQMSRERKKRKRGESKPIKGQHRKRPRDPIITNLSVVHIDLTGDSFEQGPIIPSSPSLSASPLVGLEDPDPDEDSEDDFWWPDSGTYDANICNSD